MNEEIIECANCGSLTISSKDIKNPDGTLIKRHTCVICGYYTQENYTLENKTLIESFLPRLYKDLSKMSINTNFFWLPSVLDFSNLAILFADGTSSENWGWTVAPYEIIPKHERPKYPIQGKENEYHTHRVSLKHSQHFPKENFISAMTFLNFLLKDTN